MELKEKILGSLVGLTIGDALGMPTSMMTPEAIQSVYGWIDGFVKPTRDNPIHGHLAEGESTDDTALAMMIVDEMIDNHGDVSAHRLAKRLVNWADQEHIMNSSVIGPSTRQSIHLLKEGKDPKETGLTGVTNGAAMKVSPIGLIHYQDEEALIKNVYQACLPSHNTSIAISGAMAIAFAVASAMRNESLNSILEATIKGADIGETMGIKVTGPSISDRIKWAISMIDPLKTQLENATHVVRHLGSSMLTYESVPMAIFYFYLTKGNPKEAILLAVNMGDDADTIASMTGAVSGAYLGLSRFPYEWVEVAMNNQDAALLSRYQNLSTCKIKK